MAQTHDASRRLETVQDRFAALAVNVRRLRESRGLSLAQLAARTGMTKTTLFRIESQQTNPTLETLLTLAEAFSVSVSDLIALPDAPATEIVRADGGVEPRSFEPLERDVGLDELALEPCRDGIVPLERVERLVERPRETFRSLGGTQTALDAVQAGQQRDRGEEIRVRRRVCPPCLDTCRRSCSCSAWSPDGCFPEGEYVGERARRIVRNPVARPRDEALRVDLRV